MIKIYKNFFDSDCLKVIEELIAKSKDSIKLKSSYFDWQSTIIQESTPIMIYDMYKMVDTDILRNRLEEVIDIKDYEVVHFMIYYWPVGSYIPWHNDSHVDMTATVYCNRYWNIDWGGLFLYKENDKILAEVPEWNKLVVQMDKDWHSTTSITKPYYSPVAGADGKFTPIPMIRTTLQIFMKKEE